MYACMYELRWHEVVMESYTSSSVTVCHGTRSIVSALKEHRTNTASSNDPGHLKRDFLRSLAVLALRRIVQ